MYQTRKEDMSVERTPVAFGDLRGWIAALKAQGELQEINAEVDWNLELGTVMRLAQGPGTGKAMLFNNIKGYNTQGTRCRRIFGSSLNSYRRIAMMMGLPPDTHPRELVKIGRTILSGSVPPKIVATGPVKENIVTGKDIDLYELPVPFWNRLDGGRYLLTYGGCVTKDPETGVMNVGVYRGMVAARDQIPILMWRAQHIGHHFTAWQNGGEVEMPIAVAMGWEPALAFTGGSPVPKGMCEYDVIGAIRADMTGADGAQEGDPTRAAQAIRRTLEEPDAPLRLALGEEAVRNLTATYERNLEDVRRWTAVSESADFPGGRSSARAFSNSRE